MFVTSPSENVRPVRGRLGPIGPEPVWFPCQLPGWHMDWTWSVGEDGPFIYIRALGGGGGFKLGNTLNSWLGPPKYGVICRVSGLWQQQPDDCRVSETWKFPCV
jgi:hypothetical protein